MTASASGPEESSPDSRPPPAHHQERRVWIAFEGRAAFRAKSRRIRRRCPTRSAKHGTGILPLPPSIDNHALDRLPAASGVWKSKAMFAGTESSTSVLTPARLRIFSLTAYTHRSLNGNVLEAGVKDEHGAAQIRARIYESRANEILSREKRQQDRPPVAAGDDRCGKYALTSFPFRPYQPGLQLPRNVAHFLSFADNGLQACLRIGEAASLTLEQCRGWLMASDERKKFYRETTARLGQVACSTPQAF